MTSDKTFLSANASISVLLECIPHLLCQTYTCSIVLTMASDNTFSSANASIPILLECIPHLLCHTYRTVLTMASDKCFYYFTT